MWRSFLLSRYAIWDGLLLTFGLADLFRGTHLAHHRWINTERDPAYESSRDSVGTTASKVAALEGATHDYVLMRPSRQPRARSRWVGTS